MQFIDYTWAYSETHRLEAISVPLPLPPFPLFLCLKSRVKVGFPASVEAEGVRTESEVCGMFRRETSALGLDDGSEAVGTGVLCAHEPLKALPGKQLFSLVPSTICCVYYQLLCQPE